MGDWLRNPDSAAREAGWRAWMEESK